MMRRFFTQPSRRSVSAFTLIELLVVIAIIAILTAILLPVFATVRENARASTSISNMHQIATGLAQFQLDQHKYPDVLFGYAVSGASMDRAYDTAASSGATPAASAAAVAAAFPGLYPEYVKDYRAFTDPNNQAKFSDTKAVKVNILCPSSDPDVTCTSGDPPTGDNGKLKAVTAGKTFYTADAYDISPAITGSNAIGGNSPTYVVRYQSSWTDINGTTSGFDCNNNSSSALCGANKENLYTHQLRWQNPPAQTYVTSTTYHVPQSGKVLVLWQNGTARKVDVSVFLSCGAAAGGCTGTGTTETPTDAGVSSGVSGVNFWKLDPTGQ